MTRFFCSDSTFGWIRLTVLILTITAVNGCAWRPFADPGIGKPVAWKKLAGWDSDRHAEAWPALLRNCERKSKAPEWSSLCTKARQRPATLTDAEARSFFETHFRPHRVHGKRGRQSGLFTGYFEPLLFGSATASSEYAHPVYARPEDLVQVDLSSLYPDLKNRRIRGRLQGNRLVPFFSREQIESGDAPLSGNELLWVNDPYALFFLHIQGSGRVRMDDGRTVGVGYADQNGHPYVAIGRVLIERNELEPEAVSMFSIRQWLIDNPQKAIELLNTNPSYVFFVLRDDPGTGPIGSMNVPLTAERSVAIDRKTIDLGTPLWIETTVPDAKGDNATNTPTGAVDYRRLVFSQDTGGAIRGPVRVDIFFGNGERAEFLAGNMKNEGKVYALLPSTGSE